VRFFKPGSVVLKLPVPNGSAMAPPKGCNKPPANGICVPNILILNDALGVLSSGQRMFLSAMVSFYNAREGGAMLKRCGFEGLSDLGGLDLERRRVIADLVLNYNGW
jgi:hypothetical protein